jgi:hypothetical protein
MGSYDWELVFGDTSAGKVRHPQRVAAAANKPSRTARELDDKAPPRRPAKKSSRAPTKR